MPNVMDPARIAQLRAYVAHWNKELAIRLERVERMEDSLASAKMMVDEAQRKVDGGAKRLLDMKKA